MLFYIAHNQGSDCSELLANAYFSWFVLKHPIWYASELNGLKARTHRTQSIVSGSGPVVMFTGNVPEPDQVSSS